MKRYSAEAARKMAMYHANRVKQCASHQECEQRRGNAQGVKDFRRLVREHGAAWARYAYMTVCRYGCNLDVELPTSMYN